MGPIRQTLVAPLAGALSAEEGKRVALELNRRAAENVLYGSARMEIPSERHTSWRISPEPYALAPALYAQLASLGNHLLAFQRASNKLYFESVKGRQPAWVHQVLDQGKPEALIDYQRMNRFRKLTPLVIRPDLVLNEQGRLVACELDSVPGGIGFTASMASDYASFGYELLGGASGLIENFAAMIRSHSGLAAPVLAIAVSEESNDYWLEQQWVGAQLQACGLETVVVRPAELLFQEDGLYVEKDGHRLKVDVLYRFFELFDLKNIPKAELVQYAAKKETVLVTPPYKAFLEEKMLFALFHHPALSRFWLDELGVASFEVLSSLFPRTWLLDPAPLPPQAVIPNLSVGGIPLTNWLQLVNTNKRERSYVIKPSGFSSLAWGSHGISFGADLSTADWETALKGALEAFPTTPYLLQEFHKPAKTDVSYYDFRSEQVRPMEGRARICPYYYVIDGQAVLSGALATICPLDKLAIHGMTDAIMTPVRADESLPRSLSI